MVPPGWVVETTRSMILEALCIFGCEASVTVMVTG